MKRPWHIWLTFALGLAVVLAALGWISWIALQYERAEADALAQAEFEEDVRRALWRMDVSSLNWPRHARLHFRVSADGDFTSPVVPKGVDNDKQRPIDPAAQRAAAIALARGRLKELQKSVDHEALVSRLREGTAGPPLRIASNVSPFGRNRLLDPGQRSRRGAPQQTELSNVEFAARQQLSQVSPLNADPALNADRVEATSPVWIGEQLLLVHREEKGNLQAVWLDWPDLRDELLGQVVPRFPQGELRPVAPDDEGDLRRRLAVLPAVFVPGRAPAGELEAWSPLRTGLAAAWGCVLFAAAAVAVALAGVVRLSERRAAFVSAVTHELRTPLTTFRMYAEMLSGGMVPQAEKRQEYLDTLRVESDRLSHLVENVLSYARLERERTKRRLQAVSVPALITQVESRLRERAGQAGMELQVEVDEAAAGLSAQCDPSVVEQILFNLVDNACKYANPASPAVLHLEVTRVGRRIGLRLRDHGPGILPADRRRLFKPFSKSAHDAAHSAPGVGLGLALSRRLARAMGGELTLERHSAGGAAFALTLRRAV